MGPGVIDLRDLEHRFAWEPLHIERFLAATGLKPDGQGQHSFAPPNVLIAITPFENPEYVTRHAAWLSDAAHLVLMREKQQPSAPPIDEECRELLAEDWRNALAQLDVSIDVVDWEPVSPDAPIKALERARRSRVQMSIFSVPEVARPEPKELKPTPWAKLPSLPKYDSKYHSSLATRLAWQGDQLGLLSTRSGGVLPLGCDASGEAISDDVARSALAPTGECITNRTWSKWTLEGGPRGPYEIHAPGNVPLGFDTSGRIGWVGSRMFVDWLYRAKRGWTWLSASDHDFPCGPSKKQYGSLDNNPIQVLCTPNNDLFCAIFERDVLLSSAVPIRWRSAGDLWIADFRRDPERAVFHLQADEISRAFDPAQEDGHGGAPALVLGPSAKARYALSLEHQVFRLRSTTTHANNGVDVVIVGGPNDGYAVFDSNHKVVRRGRGRLLGGAFQFTTLIDDGRYIREDIATGARTDLGPADELPATVVAIPGAKNVLLVDCDENGQSGQYRIV